jgi:adenylyltransferase/sulfurtransferase
MVDSSNSLAHAAGPQRTVVRDTISENHQVTCLDYQKILLLEQQQQQQQINGCETICNKHLLLDVRTPSQFALCALPGAYNIPWQQLPERLDEVRRALQEKKIRTETDNAVSSEPIAIYCICRRGVDSIHATKFLLDHSMSAVVYNIEGGLDAWRETVDPSFPKY